MRVGLFHTGGFTETGALQHFLEKRFPCVQFTRCFPARDRRLPLPQAREPSDARTRITPRPLDAGVTGRGLIEKMLDILERYHRGPARCDAYLLVDDADCRFCGSSSFCGNGGAALDQWKQSVSDRAARALAEQVPVFCWLAFQEVEAWLLADWSHTFKPEYPDDTVRLQRELLVHLGLDSWNGVEAYGCPEKPSGCGCTHKISSDIQEAFGTFHAAKGRRLFYSKSLHGNPMLRRLDAETVGRYCLQFKSDCQDFQSVLFRLAGET